MGVQSASGMASRVWLLGYGFNEIAQVGTLADGDGEADLRLATDGDHGVGVEAAVGPHRELPLGPSMAHPPHGLPQEVGGAPSGVGAALAQPRHQHVAGSGGHGQQRVIASLASVAMVSRPLLGQPVGLADGGVQVDGQRPVAGSGAGGPGPGQQFPAHPVQLADMAPAEAAQERPQSLPSRKRGVEGALTTLKPRAQAAPPDAQRIGVVDAVAASQRGSDQRHYLVAGVGPARRIAQVQAVVVEGDLDAVGVVAWQLLLGAPSLGSVLCFENHYPKFWGAPFCFFRRSLTRARSVYSGLSSTCSARSSASSSTPARLRYSVSSPLRHGLTFPFHFGGFMLIIVFILPAQFCNSLWREHPC